MKKLIILLIALISFGCATAKYQTKGLHAKTHFKYATKIENARAGKAMWLVTSYYSTKFNGRKTASGEVYNMFDFTCAHKKLPFGTKLKVTNPENNKSVVVRVTDRGPFVKGRDLDISYAAAKKIGLIKYGYKKFKVEVLKK